MRTTSIIAAALAALATACTDEQPVRCVSHGDCDSGNNTGTCVQVASGDWCAYRDPSCGGTQLRFADDVPDELASTCVAPQILVGGAEPADGEADVSPRTTISIELFATGDPPVADPALRLHCGGDPVEGTIAYDAISRRLELVPDAMLPLGATCFAEVVTSVEPGFLGPVPHRWSFDIRPGTWQPVVAISEAYAGTPAAPPQVAVSRRGDAMVHWTLDAAGFAWATQTAVGAWTDVGGLDDDVDGLVTSLDAGVALWRRRSSGESGPPWELTSSPLPTGQPWAPQQTPVAAGIVGDPVVAADGRGSAVAAWLEDAEGNRRIVASHYDRISGGWGQPVAIDTPSGAARSALRIAAIDTGRFALVWMAQAASGAGFQVLHSHHNGRRWSPPSEISADPSFDLDTPEIAEDGAGTLVVVWRHGVGPDRHRLLARKVGPTTAGVHVLDDGLAAQPRSPRVAREHDGTVTAIWLQETTSGRQLAIAAISQWSDAWGQWSSWGTGPALDIRWHAVVPSTTWEPVIAWSVCEGNRASIYIDGHAGSDEGSLDDLPCDTMPALAANAAGELILVWDHRDEVAGTWQLHARSFR